MPTNFESLLALKTHIEQQKKGFILLPYRNVEGYDGMVLGMAISFDIREKKYELDLQWISFGLDLFGENLVENYLYEFDNLEDLLTYIGNKYNIQITDIPLNYKIDASQFPDPIKNKDKIPVFEKAWKRFQIDFKNNNFLDHSLKLTYSSQD